MAVSGDDSYANPTVTGPRGTVKVIVKGTYNPSKIWFCSSGVCQVSVKNRKPKHVVEIKPFLKCWTGVLDRDLTFRGTRLYGKVREEETGTLCSIQERLCLFTALQLPRRDGTA